MSDKLQSFKERLESLMHGGENYAQFAQRCGVSPQQISYWMLGKQLSPRLNTGARMAAALGVNPNWLIFGIGPMTGEDNRDAAAPSNTEPYDLGHARPIPVVGLAEAGHIMRNNESVVLGDDVIYSDIKGHNLFAVRIVGDSMEPRFQTGDLIVVNPNLRPESGDYVLAEIGSGDGAVFKKLVVHGKTTILRSLNPSFEDIVLGPRDRVKLAKVVERKTIL